MNNNVLSYYRATTGDGSFSSPFFKVIALHETENVDWELLRRQMPEVPKGWFELCRLPQNYRIEFTRDYWLGKLPYLPHFHDYLPAFFAELDDVGVYITQQNAEGPFEAHMVYSLDGNQGFFAGRPPANDETLLQMAKDLSQFQLPVDYLAFLQIHDGFGKAQDAGMVRASNLMETYERFQIFLSKQDPMFSQEGEIVDPRMLLPFYESYGLHCYQCFYADWYPEQEMGNVYYSGIEHTISDFYNREAWGENLAFPTFLDWLLFYLRGMEEI